MKGTSLRPNYDDKREPEPSSILGKRFTPFWLPGDACRGEASSFVREMAGRILANIINYLNFSDRSLFVHVRGNAPLDNYLLTVYPEPCLDSEITCRWKGSIELHDFQGSIRNLVIDDGKSMIIVPVTLKTMNKESFTVQLPETNYVLSRRKIKRYPSSDVTVTVKWDEQEFQGELKDFSSYGFRVHLKEADNLYKPFCNREERVKVELEREQKAFFSGECTCVRIQQESGRYELVFSPTFEEVNLHEKRSIRNPRVQLTPPPSIHFEHPILKQQLQIEIHDISSSGFSFFEDSRDCLLIPGMIIHDLNIKHAGFPVIRCLAQVLYQKHDGNGLVRCALGILDIKIDDYLRLNQIVGSALDPCVRISTQIDQDALWEFFFSSGFIYPKKYQSIYSCKRDFMENYRKLYQENSGISSHFVYQRGERIYGHISILRAYTRTWLVHHHAGRALKTRRSGLVILKQAMHYFNDFYRLRSSGIDYAMCFFRPENRFPNLVFGDFERKLKNRQACSMDLFAYLLLPNVLVQAKFEDGWTMRILSSSDRKVLGDFYDKESGGLLLKAMSLDAPDKTNTTLETKYARHGFFRKMKIYSLKKDEELVAILIADYSSKGLNLSNALNCIKVLVIKEKDLSWGILHRAISRLGKGYDSKEVSVMCYPSKFLEDRGISFERTYQLWVLKLDCIGKFMEYTNQRFKFFA